MLTSLALLCLLPAISTVIFIVAVIEDHLRSRRHHHS